MVHSFKLLVKCFEAALEISLAVWIDSEREFIRSLQRLKLLFGQQIFIEVLELARAFDPDVSRPQCVLELR